MKKFNFKTKEIRKSIFKNFKENIFKDIKIKIICFILGISTFIIISFIQTEEKIFLSPLIITGLKEDFIISSSIPTTVKVIVKDKKNTLDKIIDSDFKIKLDLSNINNIGNYNIKLNFDIPKSMQSIYNSLLFTSINLNPDKINLEIDNLVEKSVPIILKTVGKVASGYKIKQNTTSVYYVRIQGPEKIISNIKYIETEPINIEGEIESFRRTINLILPSPLIKFIGINKIDVFFEIVEDLETLTYRIDNILIHNLNKNLQIEPFSTNFIIKIRGTKEKLLKISKDDIIINVDLSNIYSPGEYLLKVNIDLPSYVKLVSIKPHIIKINIKKK